LAESSEPLAGPGGRGLPVPTWNVGYARRKSRRRPVSLLDRRPFGTVRCRKDDCRPSSPGAGAPASVRRLPHDPPASAPRDPRSRLLLRDARRISGPGRAGGLRRVGRRPRAFLRDEPGRAPPHPGGRQDPPAGHRRAGRLPDSKAVAPRPVHPAPAALLDDPGTALASAGRPDGRTSPPPHRTGPAGSPVGMDVRLLGRQRRLGRGRRDDRAILWSHRHRPGVGPMRGRVPEIPE